MKIEGKRSNRKDKGNFLDKLTKEVEEAAKQKNINALYNNI